MAMKSVYCDSLIESYRVTSVYIDHVMDNSIPSCIKRIIKSVKNVKASNSEDSLAFIRMMRKSLSEEIEDMEYSLRKAKEKLQECDTLFEKVENSTDSSEDKNVDYTIYVRKMSGEVVTVHVMGNEPIWYLVPRFADQCGYSEEVLHRMSFYLPNKDTPFVSGQKMKREIWENVLYLDLEEKEEEEKDQPFVLHFVLEDPPLEEDNSDNVWWVSRMYEAAKERRLWMGIEPIDLLFKYQRWMVFYRPTSNKSPCAKIEAFLKDHEHEFEFIPSLEEYEQREQEYHDQKDNEFMERAIQLEPERRKRVEEWFLMRPHRQMERATLCQGRPYFPGMLHYLPNPAKHIITIMQYIELGYPPSFLRHHMAELTEINRV